MCMLIMSTVHDAGTPVPHLNLQNKNKNMKCGPLEWIQGSGIQGCAEFLNLRVLHLFMTADVVCMQPCVVLKCSPRELNPFIEFLHVALRIP